VERLFSSNRRLARRERLYRAGDPNLALHVVRVGMLKTVALIEDGREQITGYCMAGDLMGLADLGLETHTSEAVALEDSEVSALPLERLEDAGADPPLLRALLGLVAANLRRSQDLTLLLGSMRAEERLATFLLDLARRQGARGYSESELILRMTRQEIASLLGLKLETVSRIFSRLRADGLIQVQGRAVKLVDAARLRGLAGHTCEPLT
jgi:CRP/FNR family transcriptional regulator, anaerobic regulatory protein